MRCDPQLLWTLVHQQTEPPEHSRRVFAHVASCPACRRTLDGLAGGEQWIGDASRWISAAEPIAPVADRDEPPTIPDLSFLDPPGHPEMLGRIDRYDIEGFLGRGGMGLVLRGFDAELQRPVAIKVLAPEWAASGAARRRFAREAQAAASVAHENVVPIYNVGADASPPYIVMRYIPGMTLERLVLIQGPLAPALVQRIASQLAAGLAAAHARGLVHRDVKPANVLVGENTDRVWLTDFGLARAADEARMTRTGVIAGTPHYMSPEQARGEPLDGRSDWFSLGCVLYFLCTGQPPFDAPSTLATLQQTISAKPKPLDQMRNDLPPALVDLVNRLLRKRPDRRPSDLPAVEEFLRRADQQLSRGFRPRRKAMKRALAFALSTAFVIVAAALWYPFGYGTARIPAAASASRPDSATAAEMAEVAVENPWGAVASANSQQPVEPRYQALVESIESVAGWNEAEFDRQVAEIEQAMRLLER